MFKCLKQAMKFILLQGELEHLAKQIGAHITYSADSSCITVMECNGSFIACSCEFTREENMRACIEWLKRNDHPCNGEMLCKTTDMDSCTYKTCPWVPF